MHPAPVLPALPASTGAAHDVREGGRWTFLQATKNAALYGLARAAIALLTPLPAPWLRALGRALGGLLYAALPRPRRTAHENLARALPETALSGRRRIARRAYVELGGYLGETIALLSGRPLSPVPFAEASRGVLDTALAEGRGVVFASAHLGPWERVAGSLVAAGVPLTTLAREGYDRRFTRILDRLRAALGVSAIYRGGPGAHVRIVRTLRRGRVLGVPMDLRSRVPSIVVPLFGVPAETPVGPARIALRTGAPVVVGTAAPSPLGLCISVTRIDTADLAAGALGEGILTERINAELSRRILALPEGWVWMHPRWPS
jgi:KDO2-lipid IV(A) lauroyltransferase